MGLDMYLSKKIFVSEYSAEDVSPRSLLKVKLDGMEVAGVKSFTIELAYWRKANAIHNWFVEHCGAGVDDCQEISVEEDDLKKLLEAITGAMDDREKAAEILPTAPGFFFGGTDYDDWYWDDLKRTREMLEKELSEEKPCWEKMSGVYVDYKYQASW